LTVDVAVEKLRLDGTLQLTIALDWDSAFPHVSSASVSFTEKYEILPWT